MDGSILWWLDFAWRLPVAVFVRAPLIATGFCLHWIGGVMRNIGEDVPGIPFVQRKVSRSWTTPPPGAVRLVPVEPTPEMIEAATDNCGPVGCCSIEPDHAREVWSAMLAVAPAGSDGSVGEVVLDWLTMAEACPKVGIGGELRHPPICDTDLEAIRRLAARAQPPAGEVAHCQACGGEVQGWMCQSCDATFTETDDGYLILHRAHPAEPAAPDGGERERVAIDNLADLVRAYSPDENGGCEMADEYIGDFLTVKDARAILAALRPAGGGGERPDPIKEALDAYHDALIRREHGGVAADHLVQAIERHFGQSMDSRKAARPAGGEGAR